MGSGTTCSTRSRRYRPAPRDPRSPELEWSPDLLSEPALTGVSRQEMHDMVQVLALGGDVKRGRPPWLAVPDQVLATILHLRVPGR